MTELRSFVVGGAGFIGSHLVDRLLADGDPVDVVDDLSRGSLANLADARSAQESLEATLDRAAPGAPRRQGWPCRPPRCRRGLSRPCWAARA